MTKLYLDLEGTIIDDWHSWLLHKPGVIRAFIDANPEIDRGDVNIFSFAVYDYRDLDTVRKRQTCIELALDCVVTDCPTVNRMIEEDFKRHIPWENISDFIQIKGKEYAWIDWIRCTQGPGKYVLIDDVVKTMTVLVGEQQIDLINVNDLVDLLPKSV